MAGAVLVTTIAFGTMVVAELGDKTQLLLLALAAKHDPKRVLLGAVAAFGILTAMAVVAGDLIGAFVSTHIVTTLAAILFILAGAWMLIRARTGHEGDDEDEAEADRAPQTPTRMRGRGAFVVSFATIALLEVGDKTQLATFGLATAYQAPLAVFVGAWGGLSVVSLLGVLAGDWIGRHVEPDLMAQIGAGVFILVGLLLLVF